jgi:two-component system, OmpR family, sensor histidine kinase CiaH
MNMILHQLKRFIQDDEQKLALKIAVASFIIFVTILTLIISASYVYQRDNEYTEFQTENQIIREGKLWPDRPRWADPIHKWWAKWPRKPRDTIVFNNDRQVIENNFIELDPHDMEFLFALESHENTSIEFQGRAYLISRSVSQDSITFLFHDLTPIRDFHTILLVIALLGSLLALIIIYLLARYLARITIEPIREQSRELEAYSHNVAHELRTPLSVMRSNLELIGLKLGKFNTHIMWWISQKQEIRGRKIFSKGAYESVSDWENNFYNDEVRSFSDIQRFIRSTDEEITGMERIIESLLFLAKPDTVSVDREIDITTKTEDIIAKYTPEHPIRYKSEKKYIYKNGSEELYSRILCNLIENAIKYKSGWDIIVDLSKSGISISNQVTQDMSTDELSRLTKVFYQSDVSRNSTGYGLGLALVAKIVEISGWRMEISCRDRVFVVEIGF